MKVLALHHAVPDDEPTWREEDGVIVVESPEPKTIHGGPLTYLDCHLVSRWKEQS